MTTLNQLIYRREKEFYRQFVPRREVNGTRYNHERLNTTSPVGIRTFISEAITEAYSLGKKEGMEEGKEAAIAEINTLIKKKYE